MYRFRWNDWNIGHIADHGISPQEAEYVVRHARRPYPRRAGDGKYLVRGQNVAGEYLQVAYVIDPDDALFVIHARPLAFAEKRRYRREK